MSVSSIDNTVSIKINNTRNASLGIRMMLEDVQRISDPRTPQDKGNLRRNTRISVLGLSGAIRWLANYAIYQESKQYVNYTTAGTGPHFAEDAVMQVAAKADTYFKKAGAI